MKNATTSHVKPGTAMIYLTEDRFCFVHSYEKGWARISFDPKKDAILEEKKVRAKDLAVLTCDLTDLPCWLYDLAAPASVLQGDVSFAPDNNGKADPDETNDDPDGGLIERVQAVVESTDAIAESIDNAPDGGRVLDLEDADDEDEWLGYRRNGKLRYKPVRYTTTKIGKKRYYDTDDDVANDLRGYERNELATVLADLLDSADHAFWPKSLKKALDEICDTETTVEFVLAKYGKLNEGMFRMTVGNVIRGIYKRQSEEGI